MVEFPLAIFGILGLIGATVARLLGVRVPWVMFVFFGVMLVPILILGQTPVGPSSERNRQPDTRTYPPDQQPPE